MPILTTTAGVSATMNKALWHRRLLQVADEYLAYHNLFVHEVLPPGYGKTVEFRRFDRLSVPEQPSPLTDEITDPAEVTPAVSSVTVSIAEYGQVVKFSQLAHAVSFDDLVGNVVERLAVHMAETVERICRNILIPFNAAPVFTQVTPGGKARTALTNTDVLNYATLVRAVSTLQVNRAKGLVGEGPNARYIGVIHPAVWAQLMQDPQVINILQYATPRGEDNPFYTGRIVHLLGVDFLVSSAAPVLNAGAIGTNDPAVQCYRTVIVGAEAAVDIELDEISSRFIIKLPGDPDSGNLLGRLGWLGWYLVFGAAVLNPAFGVEIISAVGT
jgi:N4-gp56 family major capsid protein